MSHKATSWLSCLEPDMLGASEFRVLFHLCDCHNASAGCFPSQAYLRERAGVSNGTVNNVLNSMEEKGLIKRHQTRDGRTKRQNPTRYILGFEMQEPQEPTPKSGDGNKPDPSPKSGVGAVSNLEADPSPKKRQSRLQPTGEEPVSNQEITSACAREGRKSDNPMVVREAEQLAKRVTEGRDIHPVEIKPWVLAHIRAAGLLSDDDLAKLDALIAENGDRA
jgi:hypothetical protein